MNTLTTGIATVLLIGSTSVMANPSESELGDYLAAQVEQQTHHVVIELGEELRRSTDIILSESLDTLMVEDLARQESTEEESILIADSRQ
ncbi:hypothetical protein ACFSJ3_10510 [Corallincola platygyrae]|uniref:Uncharacterized protein n=1 Tax=Corallincola platygyrae TaxID=1193278 RepID=A0ABW4XPM1_9GAMM